MGRGDKHRESRRDAADAQVTVTDTGNAEGTSEATAVTGYRGRAPRANTAPAAPVRVSGTGDATALGGGLASTGYIHQVSAEQLTIVQQRVPREPAVWPHQVGVIPPRAQSFQHRAEVDRLRAMVEGGGTAVLYQVPTGRVLVGMGGVGKTQLAAVRSHRLGGRQPGPPGLGHCERPLTRGDWVRAGRRRAVPSQCRRP